MRHELLTGVNVLGYPIGANGIAFYHGDLYVTNTFPGRVLRIPVWPDGGAGDSRCGQRSRKCRNRRWQVLPFQ